MGRATTVPVLDTRHPNAGQEHVETAKETSHANLWQSMAIKSTTGLFQDSRVEKSTSALMSHANTLHPTVLAKVETETVRVMFDSGTGSSYLCTDVITKLNLKPTRKEQRCIEQEMFGTTRLGTYKFTTLQYNRLQLKDFHSKLNVSTLKRMY